MLIANIASTAVAAQSMQIQRIHIVTAAQRQQTRGAVNVLKLISRNAARRLLGLTYQH